jgi:hypothetical protein
VSSAAVFLASASQRILPSAAGITYQYDRITRARRNEECGAAAADREPGAAAQLRSEQPLEEGAVPAQAFPQVLGGHLAAAGPP